MVAVALLLPPPPPRTCESSSAREGVRGRELPWRGFLCGRRKSLLLLMGLDVAAGEEADTAAGARKKSEERTARATTAMRTGRRTMLSNCTFVNSACVCMVRVIVRCVAASRPQAGRHQRFMRRFRGRFLTRTTHGCAFAAPATRKAAGQDRAGLDVVDCGGLRWFGLIVWLQPENLKPPHPPIIITRRTGQPRHKHEHQAKQKPVLVTTSVLRGLSLVRREFVALYKKQSSHPY